MSYGLEIEQGLVQQLNQFQIQSLNILSLDNYELEQFLQNEFVENPMLDYQPEGEISPSPILGGNAGGMKEIQQMEVKDETSKDKKEIFLEQLDVFSYTKTQNQIIEYMIDCLEDSGILSTSAEEIVEKFGVTVEESEWCRKELTALDPPGVFAVNIQECLILQLERRGALDQNLKEIIENHLDDVASGNLASISRTLNISTAQVRKYIHVIQSTNPRPFSNYNGEKAQYIVPDILLTEDEGEWKIELNDSWIGNYSLNDYYLKMMNQIEDPQLKDYFQKKYERCCCIIASIEQRRNTILKISKAIVERQDSYFRKGNSLKPMNMQNIADDIGMHVSTVSRAIKGKYIQHSRGTTGLKALFAASYSFGQQEITAEDIKKEIRSIINHEDVKKPYSDSKISKMLEEHKIKISRRTVAKYREEMGIKGIYYRKAEGTLA